MQEPSDVTAEDLRRAHTVHPIAVLQEEWSLAERGIEQDLVPVAELGTVVVAHSPTGHGLLYRQAGPDGGAASATSTALRAIATLRDATPGQVALAWVHAREQAAGTHVIPLPGTTNVDHLRAGIAAADLHLTGDELRKLDSATCL